MTTGPSDDHVLHVVPDPAPDPDPDGSADPHPPDEVEEGDPLLGRAQRIADLPLAERPAAFDGLNRAIVGELQTLEEG